jgi:glutathione S-transferase
MILHVFPPSPRALKVLALANHLKLDFETRIVDLFKGDQLKPEYAMLNPNKRMPVLEDDGFVLWESNAILFYLAAKSSDRTMWPADLKGQAEVLRWMTWEAAHWTPACIPLAFERVVKGMAGRGAPDEAVVEKALPEFHRCAEVLDAHLKGRAWLTGANLTIADFAVGSAMAMAVPARYPIEGYGQITRWYGALAALPAWKKSLVAPPPA